MPRPPGDKRPTRRTSPKGVTLLTPQAQASFLANLQTGVPIPVAATGANLSPNTVNAWLVNGRKAIAKRDRNETLSAFEEACATLTLEAQKVYEGVHLLLAGRIVAASADDWRAATWMLQRRHPETWGAPDRIEVTGPGGGPIEVAEVERRALEYIDVDEEPPSGNGQRALG